MAGENYVNCKMCGVRFGYSESSLVKGEDYGHSAPEYCVDCRKKHKSMKAGMAVGYFNMLKRRKSGIVIPRSSALGAVYHPDRPHIYTEVEGIFDKDKYGITEKDVEEIYGWLKDPRHQVAVVKGATGSGKSTALVKYLVVPPKGIPADFFTHNGQIFISQPQRMSAKEIGKHTADLMGTSYGEGFEGGYHIGGERKADWRNIWISDTHGILLNVLLSDQLEKVGIIFIDEAHTRSLQLDQVFFLLKKRLHLYPHIKLFVVSATIDEDRFVDYFGGHTAKKFIIKGMSWGYGDPNFRPQAESLNYDNLSELTNGPLVDATAIKVVEILEETHNQTDYRDVLVFVHGKDAIFKTIKAIEERLSGKPHIARVVDLLPLHTGLEDNEKDLATELGSKDRIRVVVSTNVAEASLTVDGVVYVVDTGIENQPYWDYATSREYIPQVLISKANAKQRWGRSGRTRTGVVYTMYTRSQYEAMLDYPIPDIQRMRLDEAVLNLKSTGISNIRDGWFDQPKESALKHAITALQNEKAIDNAGAITEQGMILRHFSHSSRVSDLIVLADEFGVGIEIASLVPVVKNGGSKWFLKWNNEWDINTKYRVWQIHRSLMKGCHDDIEFILRIITLWEQNSSEWSQDHFIDDEQIGKILEDRDEILKSLTKMKGNKSSRRIDWKLLDRVRMLLAVIFWEILEQAADELPEEYEFQPRIEEKEGGHLSCNCWVDNRWVKALKRLTRYQPTVTPMMLGKIVMWWEELVCEEARVKNAESRLITEVKDDTAHKTALQQRFERFTQGFNITQFIDVKVIGHFAPSIDNSARALIVQETTTGVQMLMTQSDLAFTDSNKIIDDYPKGTQLNVLIRDIDAHNGTVSVSFLPHVQAYQQNFLASLPKHDDDRYWVTEGVVFDIWEGKKPRVVLKLTTPQKPKEILVIVDVYGYHLVLPSDRYAIGNKYQVVLETKGKPFRTDLPNKPEGVIFTGGVAWNEGKLTVSGGMSHESYLANLSLSPNSEIRGAINDLYSYSNQLRVFRMFDQKWIKEVIRRYPTGSKTNGEVIRVIPKGDSITGYIIELDRYTNATGFLGDWDTTDTHNEGDQITVKIKNINPEASSIAFTQKDDKS